MSMLARHPSMTSLNTQHDAPQHPGDTPLMLAVRWGRVEIVKKLVTLPGVDLKTRDREGRSLMDMARWG